MGSFSIWHWLVVLAIVLVLFGRGRVSDIMGEFGKGLKSFKDGIKDDAEETASRRIEGPQHDAKPAAETVKDGQSSEPVESKR